MTYEKQFQPMVFTVEGTTGKYLVTNYRPHHYSCTCRDYIFRSHDKEGFATGHKCKHILKIISEGK